MPVRLLALLRSLTPNDRLHRLEHDQQVEPKRHVLDVVEIEFKFLAGLSQSCAIAVAHLGPACEAWANHVAQLEVGNLLGQPRDELRPLGSRADKAHIAAQYVPKL